MSNNNTRVTQEIRGTRRLDKPPVIRLLAHIFSAVFSSGMIFLLFLGGALITYLGHRGLPTGDYLVLLFGAIIVLSFLRGCKAWQNDLDTYQKNLSDTRHTYDIRS